MDFRQLVFLAGVCTSLSLVSDSQSIVNTQCSHLLEVIAVLDGSDSIDYAEFASVKASLTVIANNLKLGTEGQRFGVVVYSSTVTEEVPMSADLDSVTKGISSLSLPQDGTNTHLGIERMTDMMSQTGRPGVPQVGIVITDGRSKKPSKTEAAAADAQNAGITMFAVGVGHDINKTELHLIASSSDRVMELANFDEFRVKVVSLVKKVCIVDGGWGNWTNRTKSDCSVSCGGGSQTIFQVRACDSPAPNDGGKDCQGSAEKSYQISCNEKECPVDGGWGDWENVHQGDCDAECGWGKRTVNQTRHCDNPEPMGDGQPCEGANHRVILNPCKEAECSETSPDCSGCRYANGIGYLPYPSDVTKYIQCEKGRKPHINTCGLGTVWVQKDLTCKHADTPVSKPTEETVTPETTAVTCLKKESDDSAWYKEHIDGFGWVKRPCAPGTVFDVQQCNCVSKPAEKPYTPVCKRQVYLPFHTSVQDMSGSYTWVQSEGVVVRGGYASFKNGTGLRIPRFSNMDFLKTLSISFRILRGQDSDKGQAIVSNGDCGIKGTIYIILKKNAINFKLLNKKNKEAVLSLPLKPLTSHPRGERPQWTDVSLTIHNGIMTAKVGLNEAKCDFSGNIAKSHCALQVGRGYGFDDFVGDLDDFVVSLCPPEPIVSK